MELDENRHKKKDVGRIRGFSTLSSIRKELSRVYVLAKETNAEDLGAITYYRGLTFILNTIADILRVQKMEDFEARIAALEGRNNELRKKNRKA